MVIGSDIETVVGHKRGESGSGSWGVGGRGNDEVVEDSTLLWAIKVARVPGGRRV